MALVWGDELDRVELRDGDWVKILSHMAKRELVRLQQMMAKGMKFTAGTEERVFDIGTVDSDEVLMASAFASLIINVKEWSMVDRQGNPVPINADTLQALHPDDYDTIVAAINERNQSRSEAEKNDSPSRQWPPLEAVENGRESLDTPDSSIVLAVG